MIWEPFHFLISSVSPFMNILLYDAVDTMRCMGKRGTLAPCCLLAGGQAPCCFKVCVLDGSTPSDADVCLPSEGGRLLLPILYTGDAAQAPGTAPSAHWKFSFLSPLLAGVQELTLAFCHFACLALEHKWSPRLSLAC